MSAISALSPLPDLEDLEARVALENRRCFMDVEPETVLALITHVRALQAENERLREALLEIGWRHRNDMSLPSVQLKARAALAASRREG